MRIRGTFFGLWCAAVLALASAQQQVEFPLDYYSFAEIAERMSVDGRRIDCAQDLRQRLALIHLKPRAWQHLCPCAYSLPLRSINTASAAPTA